MRLWCLVLILVVVATLAAGCSAPESVEPEAPGEVAGPAHQPEYVGGARISFAEEEVHFGEATPDQRMEQEFRFRNVGDAPLEIDKVMARTLEGC